MRSFPGMMDQRIRWSLLRTMHDLRIEQFLLISQVVGWSIRYSEIYSAHPMTRKKDLYIASYIESD